MKIEIIKTIIQMAGFFLLGYSGAEMCKTNMTMGLTYIIGIFLIYVYLIIEIKYPE